MKKNYPDSAKTTCTGCIRKIDPEFYMLRGNFCPACSGGSKSVSYNDRKVQESIRALNKKSTGFSEKLKEQYPNLKE